jgi:hypothetical protein
VFGRRLAPLRATWRRSPKTLHAKGFHTVARVANPTVDADAGFAQGFDDFAVPAGLERGGPGMLEGEPLVADAVRLIGGIDRPTFLWLHLMDPHGPYFPPDDYRRGSTPPTTSGPATHRSPSARRTSVST